MSTITSLVGKLLTKLLLFKLFTVYCKSKINIMDGYEPRYHVVIYHGGERSREEYFMNSLGSARQMTTQGEHSEIVDLKTQQIVE